MENTQHIFVYGTLRQDFNNDNCSILIRYADFIDKAAFQGKLYKIDYYPGVVPSDNPSDLVQGEVYRLNVCEFALVELDKYEECGTGFDEPTEYVREIHFVRLCSGEMIPAWVYVYNRPTDGLGRLPSGDFLNDGIDL